MVDTFDNVARRDARRQRRGHHMARMEEISSPHFEFWDDEPIAPSIGEARLREHAHEERKVAGLNRILTRPFCGALLCLATVAAAITGFLLGLDVGEQEQNAVTNAPEISADTRYESLFNTILDWGVTPQSALEEEDSAQWHALQWLAYKDWETQNMEAVRTRYALATLYFSTHDVETSGAPLSWLIQTHWLSSYPVCLWHGVECHEEDNTLERVQSLNLTSNGLGGTLPDELSMLQLDIHYMDLSDNAIEGTIPESLSSLRNLQGLYLGPNYLHSTIPPALMRLSHLTHLFINDCALFGTIPDEIGGLTQLSVLGLHSNFLTGAVPDDVEKLENLYALYLDDNLLRGQIPSSIGNLTRLVDLRLRRNQLEGTLPEALNHLRSLEILYLDSNEFIGTLPSSLLSSLLLLQELHLYDNQLFGTIPKEIGSPVLLNSIYLDGNDFHGPLPSSFGYLRNLESLYLFGNRLTGTIPTDFGLLRNLRSLRLNANQLTGLLPSELSSLDRLETLFLNDNFLTGTIPSLGGMKALNKVTLHGNSFQGAVPPSLCSLTLGNLHDLTADCEGTPPTNECSCCSLCY